MALASSLNIHPKSSPPIIINPNYTICKSPKFHVDQNRRRSLPRFSLHCRPRFRGRCLHFPVVNGLGEEFDPSKRQGDNREDLGVKAALSLLRFYKSELSPLLPKSCRYVPTCSEYSMIAYRKYGFTKGSILTVWRICRCNPLGGSGFDPPRWFDEPNPKQE